MTDKQQIEEMVKDKEFKKLVRLIENTHPFYVETIAERVYKKYQPRLPEDSVVLTRGEYEKLKSLYDSQQGAYMTSAIGDLPLTVEGLRKAVDEITRLLNVQIELQELNIKSYNDAKDLRRKLKEARKETAREILSLYSLSDTFSSFQEKVSKQFEVEVE